MSRERVVVAVLAVMVLVAASSTALVVAETRRHLIELVPAASHGSVVAVQPQHLLAGTTAGATNGTAATVTQAPTYQLCPDGSYVPQGQACPQPVHHTRPS